MNPVVAIYRAWRWLTWQGSLQPRRFREDLVRFYTVWQVLHRIPLPPYSKIGLAAAVAALANPSATRRR